LRLKEQLGYALKEKSAARENFIDINVPISGMKNQSK